MARFVSPPADQLNNLRQSLEDGERIVFDFFNTHLSPEWEIYIQPHLNGLRPDFVLLHPKAGIAVFEVKDWNLDAMEYWVEPRTGKPPILLAQKDGKKFSKQNENPVEKVYRYKQELYQLYCPRLRQNAGFSVITAGIIFPFAQEDKLKQLFSQSLDYREMGQWPQYNPLSGANSIESGDIRRVFPESIRKSSYHMNDTMAKDLRNWLVEPDFSATQRQPLELDKNQISYVKSRTATGYRRIKGAAGSGKSLILAARAAELLGEGKSILVVTFNITLLHYLMDVSVRWQSSSGKTRTDITWLNFHLWCKRVCADSDNGDQYDALWTKQPINEHSSQENDDVLNSKLPALVAKIIDADQGEFIPRYDAVLVDEGQDFLPDWWNALRKVCRKDGEMLLVADATQDVYGTAKSWTDEAMTGAGFPGGRWAELTTSYRLPPKALELASSFADRFLPKDTIDLPRSPQLLPGMYPCTLKWIQTSVKDALSICKDEIFHIAISDNHELLAIPDITFLTDSQEFGLQVVGELGKQGVKAVHTFSKDNKESRRMKMGFYMGDSRIKATTLHSFKGWETRALVIFIGAFCSQDKLALIYTGLTRIKRHAKGSYLTIVSCSQELHEYGKTWPEYQSRN
jgi:hypothetical protein